MAVTFPNHAPDSCFSEDKKAPEKSGAFPFQGLTERPLDDAGIVSRSFAFARFRRFRQFYRQFRSDAPSKSLADGVPVASDAD